MVLRLKRQKFAERCAQQRRNNPRRSLGSAKGFDCHRDEGGEEEGDHLIGHVILVFAARNGICNMHRLRACELFLQGSFLCLGLLSSTTGSGSVGNC